MAGGGKIGSRGEREGGGEEEGVGGAKHEEDLKETDSTAEAMKGCVRVLSDLPRTEKRVETVSLGARAGVGGGQRAAEDDSCNDEYNPQNY